MFCILACRQTLKVTLRKENKCGSSCNNSERVNRLGLYPLRLSSLFKTCGLWTLSFVTVSLKIYETLKWRFDATHLNTEIILDSGGDSVALGIISLSSPTSWDLGPRQYLFGDNSALGKFERVRECFFLFFFSPFWKHAHAYGMSLLLTTSLNLPFLI